MRFQGSSKVSPHSMSLIGILYIDSPFPAALIDPCYEASHPRRHSQRGHVRKRLDL